MNNDNYSFGDYSFDDGASDPSISGKPQYGGTTSDTASKGMMMSGNPYVMGAGLGLQVLSMREKRKQAERETKSKLKLDRLQRQQSAINNLMSLSSRLKL